MCGRYTLVNPELLSTRYGTDNKLSFEPSYNIAPGYRCPVVVREANSSKLELMRWGLIPSWAKDKNIGYKMINARSESISEKPAFKVPVNKRRCLIPASGFYEWKKLKLESKAESYPWYFTLKNTEIFSFAGIYDVWKDEEDHQIVSFSIITTEANDVVKDIHKRMPVILDKHNEMIWNDGSTSLEKVLDLLKPIESSKIVKVPVSRRVNSPKNDDKELLTPVDRPEAQELFT